MRVRFLDIARVLLLAAAYAAAAKLGLMLDPVSGFATVVWPPSGIALAAVVLFGHRLWPGIWLGAFLVNAEAGAPLAVAAGIAIGNTAEAVLGAHALRRLPDFRAQLDRLKDVLALVACAALASTLVSATIGVFSLWLGGIVSNETIMPTWISWWVGDALGDVVFAPLFLAISGRSGRRLSPRRLGEAIALGICLAGIGMLVLTTKSESAFSAFRQPYLLAVPVGWAALRFGQRGATVTTFFLSVAAVASTAFGLSPFIRQSLHESLLHLEVFMGTMAVTSLALGAVNSERERAEDHSAALLERERAARAASEKAADRSMRLNSVTAALSRAAAPEQVIEAVLQHGAAAVGARAGFVALLSPNGLHIEVAGAVGYSEDLVEKYRRIPIEAALPLCDAIRRAEPVLLASDEQAARAYPASSVGPTGGGAFVALPLLVEGKSIGGIGFQLSGDRVFDDDDRIFLGVLANQCALALERAHLFESERRAHGAAQAAIAARDDFMSVAAHELRTPLSALMLQLGSLKAAIRANPSDGKAPSTATKIDRAARQTDRLAALIEALLDVSRIGAGRLELQREPCDLSQIVAEVLERFAEELRLAHCSLQVDVPATITGNWDKMRVEQILTNLLSNAIKYGSGRPIEITAAGRAGVARVDVRDHGIGIPSKDLPRIFEMYERAVSTRHYGGLGLGLFIARQIAHAHGGELSARSEPGAGSTFTLDLPCEDRTFAAS